MTSKIKQLEQIIHEQAKALQDKDRALKELENVIELLPGHIYWLDTDNVVLGCNGEQARDLGLKDWKDVIGMRLEDFFPQDVVDELVSNNAQVTNGAVVEREEPHVDAKGVKKTYHSRKVPLIQNGKIVGILGTSIDLTKQKELEYKLDQALKEVRKTANTADIYLRSILENSPENIYWMDLEGRIVGCNENQAHSHGYESIAELIGNTVYDVGKKLGWDKSIADIIVHNNYEIMTTGKEIIAEESAIFNGEKRYYLSHKLPLRDNEDKIIGILGMSTDITKYKQMEQNLIVAKERAEASNKAKNEFIRNMSHDIRTPFAGIYSMAQLIQKKITDKAIKKDLGHIVASSKKLLDFLNEILDVTKVDVDSSAVEVTAFSLSKLIDDIIKMVKPQLKNKNVKLQVKGLHEISEYVISDQARLHRILLNLISNSIKFTENGAITITFKKVEQFGSSLKLKIIVKDTGIGIPSSQYKFIFEPFIKLNSSYKGLYSGTGLGLFMVKKFIEDLNGKIEVTSKLNKGSIFTCTLDFELPTAEEVAQLNTAKEMQDTRVQIASIPAGLSFLLIEDDKLSQLVTKAIIENFNCHVDIAGNATEARKFLANKYDMIIMDVGLPDIDGADLAYEIRNKFDIKTPIIALTAHADEKCHNQCLAAGIGHVVIKPITEKLFMEACNKVIFALCH